jgi:AraC family transcriptional regulator, transcriptional activator of pobA
MDRSRIFWYFSTMRRKRSKPVREVEFNRGKYGHELLIDAALVRDMPTFITDRSPHILRFHDVLLITRGHGKLILDAQEVSVEPGSLVVTLPGQTREWHIGGRLDGACLFFVEEFLGDAFSDPHFIDQFSFLRESRAEAVVQLSILEQRAFRRQFVIMQKELARFRVDSVHALRAALYAALVGLDRSYVTRHGAKGAKSGGRVVGRFRKLVERHFRAQHGVIFYAKHLGVSPGHLNVLCKSELGRSAGELVRARVMLEASRLLRHGDLRAGETAERLGFTDPAYFARVCRRELGVSPRDLRRSR